MSGERPALAIRPVNPYDDAETHDFHAIYVDAERAAIPDASLFSLTESRALFRRTPVGQHVCAYGAFDDGRMSPWQQHVDQWGTIVHPAHRGHRLGMAIKVAQLGALHERFPDKHYIGTRNAETNAQMVAINEALGFRLHSLWAEFQRILPEYGAAHADQ